MAARILYIEDNPDDVMLVELAFRKAGTSVTIEVVNDGERAISTLKSAGPEAAPPHCVLLDLKLPNISGLDVLTWIRSQPELRRLPVIMFTSSLLPDDINKAYDLGANSYLVKPPDLESLVAIARMIESYWLQFNTPAVRS